MMPTGTFSGGDGYYMNILCFMISGKYRVFVTNKCFVCKSTHFFGFQAAEESPSSDIQRDYYVQVRLNGLISDLDFAPLPHFLTPFLHPEPPSHYSVSFAPVSPFSE